MYNKDSKTDWLNDVIVAAAGAGVVTSLAVVQGQSLGTAAAITAFAAIAAVLCNRLL